MIALSMVVQGLTQFKADYPIARCVLLFGGGRREHRDGIELLPVAAALADPTTVLRQCCLNTTCLNTTCLNTT